MPAMILLLGACTYISAQEHAARLADLAGESDADTDADGDTDADSDADTDVEPGDLHVTGVDPPYGTDAGGTDVVVTGGPFDDATDVWFGDVQGTVESVSATSLTVVTPRSTVDGAVVVTVSGGGDSVDLANGFTYWADATGQAAATGELIWYFLAGGYWSETQEEYGRSTLRFTEPFEYQYYWYWAPTLDTCVTITEGVSDYSYDPTFVPYDARGGTALQQATTATITLPWNAAEERFTKYDLTVAEFDPGETYDLTLEGTPGLPEIALDDVFPVPARFQVTEPAIFGASMPNVTEDQHFAWSTDETGDAVLLQLGMLTEDGGDFEQEVFCALRDVGSFTIPDGAWTRWRPGRRVDVLVGRYNSGHGLVPWNQGNIATASTVWFYGAGNTR
jgi:hypothetical protein